MIKLLLATKVLSQFVMQQVPDTIKPSFVLRPVMVNDTHDSQLL